MGQQEIVDTPAGGSFAPGDLPRRSRSGRVASCLAAAAILLVIGGSVAYLRRYAEPAAEMAATAAPPIPAHTITAVAVERRALAHRLALIGSVVAWEELPVGTEATGLRVTQVLVDEGDRVDQGQLLARLNDEVLRAQIAQNEAQLERAKASIRMQQAAITEATASLEEAEANLRRASALNRARGLWRASPSSFGADNGEVAAHRLEPWIIQPSPPRPPRSRSATPARPAL